jgi:hypothetical protein
MHAKNPRQLFGPAGRMCRSYAVQTDFRSAGQHVHVMMRRILQFGLQQPALTYELVQLPLDLGSFHA